MTSSAGRLDLWMHPDGNPTSVVGDGDGLAITVQGDANVAGVSIDGFIHSVVDDFPNQMMETVFPGASNVHTGAFAYRLRPSRTVMSFAV